MSVGEDGRAALETDQPAVRRALLDPAGDRDYFVYLTNRKVPLAGPCRDLTELSMDVLDGHFGMGYSNLWVLRRHCAYTGTEWIDLATGSMESQVHTPRDCGGRGEPHFVLLAMGDWPGP